MKILFQFLIILLVKQLTKNKALILFRWFKNLYNKNQASLQIKIYQINLKALQVVQKRKPQLNKYHRHFQVIQINQHFNQQLSLKETIHKQVFKKSSLLKLSANKFQKINFLHKELYVELLVIKLLIPMYSCQILLCIPSTHRLSTLKWKEEWKILKNYEQY